MRTIPSLILAIFFSTTANSQYTSFTCYDLDPGNNSSSPNQFTAANGNMYFAAATAATGVELWISDGTISGTHIVKDIVAGARDGFPEGMTGYNGMVVFSANDDIHGTELWITDGTEPGTYMVKDINPGSRPSYPANFIVFNGKLYFSADEGRSGFFSLWVTDGTANGTRRVSDINSGGMMAAAKCCICNGKLYFLAYDAIHGTELWVSDGSDAGTHIVKDLYPGLIPSNVDQLTPFNGLLYFKASIPSTGKELWVTDGTDAGTHVFVDINPSPIAGLTDGLNTIGVVYNDKLYFSANDGTTGPELWATDGTVAGTFLVKEINTGSAGSLPDNMCVSNNRLYFSATTALYGEELWTSDGTDTGTIIVKDIRQGSLSSNPVWPIDYKGKLYFWASNDGGALKLYSTDGSDSSTYITEPNPITVAHPATAMTRFFEFNSSLYFTAMYNDNGRELWSLTNNLFPETVQTNSTEVFRIYPNPSSGNFSAELAVFNSEKENTLVLYDVLGRRVYEEKLTAAKTDVSTKLSSGLYTVQLRREQQVINRRMLIQ